MPSRSGKFPQSQLAAGSFSDVHLLGVPRLRPLPGVLGKPLGGAIQSYLILILGSREHIKKKRKSKCYLGLVVGLEAQTVSYRTSDLLACRLGFLSKTTLPRGTAFC
jgi:hypothetical protein